MENLARNMLVKISPHLHLEEKSSIILIEEMTCESFIDWLRENL
jgi:hypothetical protein